MEPEHVEAPLKGYIRFRSIHLFRCQSLFLSLSPHFCSQLQANVLTSSIALVRAVATVTDTIVYLQCQKVWSCNISVLQCHNLNSLPWMTKRSVPHGRHSYSRICHWGRQRFQVHQSHPGSRNNHRSLDRMVSSQTLVQFTDKYIFTHHGFNFVQPVLAYVT